MSGNGPTPTASAPAATVDHGLGVFLHRVEIEPGTIAREGEVRPRSPKPIAGFPRIVGIQQGVGFGTSILHGLIEHGPPKGGLA